MDQGYRTYEHYDIHVSDIWKQKKMGKNGETDHIQKGGMS